MASPRHMSLSVNTAYHPGTANPTRSGIRSGETAWIPPRFDDLKSVPTAKENAMGNADDKTKT